MKKPLAYRQEYDKIFAVLASSLQLVALVYSKYRRIV